MVLFLQYFYLSYSMKFIRSYILLLFIVFFSLSLFSQTKRARDYGIEIGVLKTGPFNSITDVEGVKVGHTTLNKGNHIRTGVTAILPHTGNLFQNKVPAAIYIGNGFGKLTGYSQIKELGNIETPIILTNTLSVPTASNALIHYTLAQEGNKEVYSVNSVVGETNDGWLNDIRGQHVKEQDVLNAIKNAETGFVSEGNVGAGTGTSCFGYKGGIGTSSRVVPKKHGGYTIGVLVQSNFGGVLQINGVPIAKEMDNYPRDYKYDVDGSCMIVVITDAPLNSRHLERLAKRAMMGLSKTGGIASNGSGDFVIAVSTAKKNWVPYQSKGTILRTEELKNESITPLFLAVIEATEEAIINSLFAAKTMTGIEMRKRKSIPIEKVVAIMKKHNAVVPKD